MTSLLAAGNYIAPEQSTYCTLANIHRMRSTILCPLSCFPSFLSSPLPSSRFVLHTSNLQARASGVLLTYIDLDEPALQLQLQEAFLYADTHKLSQVFRNLVSNALKFTPMGGTVTLSVSVNGPLLPDRPMPLFAKSRSSSMSTSVAPMLDSLSASVLQQLNGHPDDPVVSFIQATGVSSQDGIGRFMIGAYDREVHEDGGGGRASDLTSVSATRAFSEGHGVDVRKEGAVGEDGRGTWGWGWVTRDRPGVPGGGLSREANVGTGDVKEDEEEKRSGEFNQPQGDRDGQENRLHTTLSRTAAAARHGVATVRLISDSVTNRLHTPRQNNVLSENAPPPPHHQQQQKGSHPSAPSTPPSLSVEPKRGGIGARAIGSALQSVSNRIRSASSVSSSSISELVLPTASQSGKEDHPSTASVQSALVETKDTLVFRVTDSGVGISKVGLESWDMVRMMRFALRDVERRFTLGGCVMDG